MEFPIISFRNRKLGGMNMKISLIVSDIDGTLTAPSADVEKGLKDLGEWIT